jgi:hypothetical protein
MDDLLSQTWREITSRPEGPLALRFYMQPLMATLLAVRDGVKDAREGNPAYLWAVLSTPGHRRELLRSGWRSIGKVFVIALVLDVVYQLLVLRGLRPLEGLFVAVVLAIVPYALIRGPINRLVRSVRGGGAPRGKPA